MLNIVTVQVQNYAGHGREYVEKLYAGVRKHMPAGVEWRGVCLTDDFATVPDGIDVLVAPDGLTGWWNKLALFKPGMFKSGDRILYFDLDTLILGDLSGLADYRGLFAGLRDPLDMGTMNSAVMAWEAGRFDHIWTRWDEAGRPSFDPHGDQNWIGAMLGVTPDYWHELHPGHVVSFKKDCWLTGRIPKDARVLMFHGRPRPHECVAAFVRELWNPGWKMPERPRIDWASKTERWPLAN